MAEIQLRASQDVEWRGREGATMVVAEPSALRRLNVAATLRALSERGPASSGALQRTTGLSRRTLEVIVNDLTNQGWIIDEVPAAAANRGAGRPARQLRFNADAGFVLGAQLDFGYMTLRIADIAGAVVLDRRSDLATNLDREARIARFFREVDAALADVGATRSDVLAVTVSTPGIVRDNGTVDLPSTFLDWTNFPLQARLDAGFDCPLIVENDAKLAALGEVTLAGEGPDANFVWVRADGVRIGLGIVIEGRLYRGTDGAAGEVVWAPLLNFESVQAHVFSGLVDPAHARHAEAQSLLAAAQFGDPSALAEVDSLAAGIAPGLQAIAWILAPHEIVIGGALASIGRPLVEAIGRRLFSGEHPVESVLRTSASSEQAIIAGATQTALSSVHARLFEGGELPVAPRRASERMTA
ncbi:ROK family protein [Curtobacterium pusillum]|uniref:ROK family protein n=1 Tax=Curtobacterium pusillum TaxID=69373 RepID=UPI001642F6E8|nr:ROK family protein [Curtobacterium pusillum]